MNRIVAFLDESPCAAGVLTAAQWLARLLGARVDPVHVAGLGQSTIPIVGAEHLRLERGEPENILIAELAPADVVMGVIGSRAVSAKAPVMGHITRSLLVNSATPLVVVAPDATAPSRAMPRILVPLDGADETARALMPVANLLAGAGATVVIVHVFDAASLPPFIGSTDDLEILADEFARRYLPGFLSQCELRLGDPSSTVVELVIEEEVDAVLVAWHQSLAPGRAEVLRRLLLEVAVPLIVVPIGEEHLHN